MKTVACAMSGGMDSLAAAIILKNHGFEVFGISMKVCKEWNEKEVREIVLQLDIPHYIIDLSELFEKEVINYLISEYLSGRTPNPCVVCNEKIKFGYLLEKAIELGADFFATGHYARVEREEKKYVLKQGKDKQKDQSYFLATLPQEVLSKIILPLGDYTKEEVRAITRGLNTLPESNEICFIPDNDYVGFIKERVPLKGGDIFDKEGNFVGKHKGIVGWTIGQRRGIRKPRDKPYYVIAIDGKANKVIIGDREDLYSDSLIAEKLNWIGLERLKGEMNVDVKTRYRKACSRGTIYCAPTNNEVLVKFDEIERAITPGQLAVFYKDEKVLGSGWIKNPNMEC